MKKPRLHILVIVTAVFAAFTLGLFLGRNQSRSAVTVSIPAAMQTAPSETALPSEEPAETTEAITFPININTASNS